jgi:hypothetical protein
LLKSIRSDNLGHSILTVVQTRNNEMSMELLYSFHHYK